MLEVIDDQFSRTVIWFAVDTHVLPALGYVQWSASPWQWFQHLILPWLALGLGGSATIARQVRGELIDTLDETALGDTPNETTPAGTATALTKAGARRRRV